MQEEVTMLEIDKTLISLDVIDKCFACDLEKCKGSCCVIGDSGAPLEEDEKYLLEESYPIVRDYMTSKGINAVEEQGWYVIDDDGDYVTPLVNNQECAYAYKEKGITFCAIEKAYFENRIKFRKPISCHLYPIRITKYKNYDAVNYETNKICKVAVEKGKREKTYIYQFLKDPLIRKYGENWYNELQIAAKSLKEQLEK